MRGLLIVLIAVAICAVVAMWTGADGRRRCEQRGDPRLPPVAGRKTIWILWLQGWNDDTPWLVWEVRRSWETFNREWRVVALDAGTLGSYVDTAPGSPLGQMMDTSAGVPMPALSDMARLTLLSQHGGVWADATLLCMRPLDEWVYDSILPCGFWMYHGRDYGDGPASWFIVSIRQSYVVRAWARACLEYWKLRDYKGQPHDYFWMDATFADLRRTDCEFDRQWRLVPYLWCEAFGQAHMLAGKTDVACSDETRCLLRHSPPHVLKLSRHVSHLAPQRSAMYEAVEASRAIRSAMPLREFEAALSHTRHAPWSMADTSARAELPDPLPQQICVVADCGCNESIATIAELCRLRGGIVPLVYDKCGFCSAVPEGVFCRPLRNVGRDLGVFVWFASRYYHVIPDSTVVYLTAGNMKKHNRAARLDAMLQGRVDTAGLIGDAGGFSLSEYDGVSLRRADPPNFRGWYERIIGPWDPSRPGTCWNALLRTSGVHIRARPRTTYINVLAELALADGLEVGHFVERCAHDLFLSARVGD